ncbi:YdcF family protein [Thiocapsa marina]|uniref:DUF218 domain-containing protein n=1 Tax=Thiocapsa marina 5811 TaxID=768671 RepID=F9UB22_9GAMM|nr:YdcF family protein [Thiocapsa marina]EGV18640.1 protein of unknown function DUF218 [Thiocapsa marina 5811]
MLYLDKLLSQLAYPLGFSIVLASLALVLLIAGWRRSGLLALSAGILWLALWSIPIVSDGLRLSLEGRFAHQPVGALPAADAVVVLGGGIRGGPPDWPDPDLGRASDRVWHAARIYHGGKAARVIVSGGAMPWAGERRSEADGMLRFLTDLGVPPDAILLEGRSRNTRENALYTAEILSAEGIDRVLLVTSALHMPRALATFRSAGINAVPAATDFEVMPEPAHLMRWLPDAEALSDSTRALKEYVGWWVYSWRGWAEL